MLTRTPARIWGALATALFCLSIPRAAHAIGETTGQISGYVFDPTNAAVSDVPIVLTGSALLAPRSVTSDDHGRYVFNNLPVGTDYVIEIDIPDSGYAKLHLAEISVVLGLTSTFDLHLTPVGENEAQGTIQVVERVNPILNPDSAQGVAVIDAEKAAETPFFHQVEGVPQQVAGVGQGNTPVTRGGLSRYGHFYVDGLDTTDITNGSITAPMNFDAVQNFEIITGGMDAQYNSMGMVENAVTKSGSNKFTWDTSITFEPAFLAAQNQYPTNTAPGFGLYYAPTTTAPQTSFYSPVVNLGGPIVKDRLWFYVSYQQNFSSKDVPISQLGLPQYNRTVTTTTSLGRIKLTWQPTSNDKLSLGLNLDRNVINNDVGTAYVTNSAEDKVARGGEFVLLNYDHNFSDSTLFSLQTGFTFEQSNTDPIFSDYTTPNHYDIDTGVDSQNSDAISFGSIPGNFLHENKWDLQFNPSLSWTAHALGTHQFKAGIQLAYQIDSQNTGVSGNERYTDRGGICDETNAATYSYCYEKTLFYNAQNQPAPLENDANALKLGVFIQDKWSISRRLTILPGIRGDVGFLYGNNQDLLATLAGLGPRIGFTYDLLGDRKTLLVGHYGRSNDTGDVFIAQHVNPQLEQVTATFNSTSDTFATCSPTLPASGVPASGCTYTGGVGNYNLVTHNSAIFKNLSQAPYMDEVTAGIHTQLVAETVFGLDYTYRYYGDMWADQEVNRIWNASGNAVLGYVNGIPQTIFKTGAYDSAYRQYNGADIWVQGTPGRWDLLASYTLSFTSGTVDNYFDGYLNNPRMTPFYQGYLASDNRHALKGSVAYKTPIGLDIGFRFTFYTGTPLWEHSTNPGDTTESIYYSPRGTGFPVSSSTGLPNFNNPSSVAAFRNPDELLMNLQLRYNLGELLRLKQSRLDLTFFIVNMLNNEQPYTLNSSYTKALPNKVGTGEYYESPLQGEFILRYRN